MANPQKKQREPEPPYRAEMVDDLHGAILADPAIWPRVKYLLKGDDHRPSGRARWEAFEALAKKGETPDEFAVIEYLERHGQLELAGGALAIQGLSTAVPSPYAHMAEQWAMGILDDSRRRTQLLRDQASSMNAYFPDVATYRANMERQQRRLDDIQRRLQGEGDAPPTYEPLGVSMADVIAEDMHWLWFRRIAFGKLAEFLGDGGVGKSLATLDIVTRHVMGNTMPDGSPGTGKPGSAVIVCGEDGLADTVKPRLAAAGVSPEGMARIRAIACVPECDPETGVVVERSFSLLTDSTALEATIMATGATLLVIDPITAYLGDGVDERRDPLVRRVLAPLKLLAERHGVAVILVRHLNRNGGASAQHRGLGSVAFTNLARLGLMFAQNPDTDGEVLVGRHKGNIGQPPPTLAYRITQVGEDENMPRLSWLGERETTVATALAAQGNAPDSETRSAADDAYEWLRAYLANRPRPADEVISEAKKAQIIRDEAHDSPLRTAKKRLGISIKNGTIYREGGIASGGRWMWQLYDGQSLGGTHLSENDTSGDDVNTESNGAPAKMYAATGDSHLSVDSAPKSIYQNPQRVSVGQQVSAQPKVRKARWMSARRS